MLLRSDRFVPTLTEKLLTYALGRGLEYYGHAGRACDRARCARRRLSRLVADRGYRARVRRSDEEGGAEYTAIRRVPGQRSGQKSLHFEFLRFESGQGH